MIASLDWLRELNTISVFLRLLLAMVLGGLIGLERGFKGRPAGFRTYLLVSLGAALTMILSQYNYVMMGTVWKELTLETGVRTDVSRFGAQVISGIGFLGAGTIIVTGHQQVKGLTTAAGLWASACMGLAVGAGFYECVLLAFVLIFASMRILPTIETFIIERTPNMNIYVEFRSLDDIGAILTKLKSYQTQIYNVEIEARQLSTLQSNIGANLKIMNVRIQKLYVNAGVVLVMLPILLIYLVLQKRFVEGVERSGIVG